MAVFLSFSAVDRPDLVVRNPRALEVFSAPVIPGKQITLSTRCLAPFFPWAVSFRSFPATLGSRLHYPHFIVTLRRSHSQTEPGFQQGFLTSEPTFLCLLNTLE